MHSVKSVGPNEIICVKDLMVGQIGVITKHADGTKVGLHVMRIYNDIIVCLENPMSSWAISPYISFSVRVLPVSTKIELTVGR